MARAIAGALLGAQVPPMRSGRLRSALWRNNEQRNENGRNHG